ncbi:tetratricopeptide repeat protein [Loigolactobacillus jiayinensis]|uniref:tetratricopeptide repeat protein n=1 Tax=Loigolactobacillus jiayinensis TaxID=2486016 RepID=UPI000F766555|nr:tetratricopeptide repeat protein [Loigolactobacillus jiayinensis]
MQKTSKDLWAKGDKQGAVKVLVAAIEKTPAQLDNYLELAAYLNALKDTQQAEKLLQSALVRFPDNQDLLYSLGTTYYAAGDYAKALTQFQQVTLPRLENDKLYMLASTYYAQQDYAHALAFAVTAQQHEPQRTDVNLLVGDLFLALGDFSHAATYYGQVLTQEPKSAAANFKVGLARLAQGLSNEAYFEKAKQLDAAYFAQEKHRLSDIERYLKAQQK